MFKNLPDKKRVFVQFYIVKFYHFISEELLNAALEFSEDSIKSVNKTKKLSFNPKDRCCSTIIFLGPKKEMQVLT